MPEGGLCGLCGHVMTLHSCGYAMANDVPLCHADDHDCYHRWTVYKERPALRLADTFGIAEGHLEGQSPVEYLAAVGGWSGDVEVVELGPRESDWTFWPLGHEPIDTGGLCDCGHEGLGPSWHMHACRCLPYIWRNRAKELHDRLWDLWEQVRRGEPVDCTGEGPPVPEDDGK